MKSRGRAAFTLIEIFVVMAVVLALTSIVFAVGKTTMESGAAARETGAARTLIAAYALATADNDGELMPGFDSEAGGYEAPDGKWISPEAAHRYPYRLAPYFGDALNGVIFVNRNRAQLKKAGFDGDTYSTSLCPALGMNAYYVGGIYEGGKLDMPKECATRVGQVPKPSSMLVFASAGHKLGTTDVDGYNRLEPPNKRVALWTDADTAKSNEFDPARYGNVDFRHNGQAVCAFLDGSVRSLAPNQLRDMRLWNRNAQAQDNPSYTVAIEAPGPGRGPGRR